MDPDSCMTEFVQFIEFTEFDENPFILEKLECFVQCVFSLLCQFIVDFLLSECLVCSINMLTGFGLKLEWLKWLKLFECS